MSHYHIEIEGISPDKGLIVFLFKDGERVVDYFQLVADISLPPGKTLESKETALAEEIRMGGILSRRIGLIIDLEEPYFDPNTQEAVYPNQINTNSEIDHISVSIRHTDFDLSVDSFTNTFSSPLGITRFWLSYVKGEDGVRFSFESGLQNLKEYS